MLPVCRPNDGNGNIKIFVLSDVSALTAWVDYIPVQDTAENALVAGTTAPGGYDKVNNLDSITGLTAFTDYLPVELVTGRSKPWTTDPTNGYIPIFAAVGSFGVTFQNPNAYTVHVEQAMPTPATTGTGLALNADGTKLYLCDHAVDDIITFTLSPAYDITSAVDAEEAWDDTANVVMREMQFNGDGTRVFYLDEFGDIIRGAPLSGAYDVSTAGAVDDTYDYSSEIALAQSFCFGKGGLKLYIGSQGLATDIIQGYDLSAAYDVSTATTDSLLDVDAIIDNIRGLAFNGDGTQCLMHDGNGNFLYMINLSVAWDINSGVVDTDTELAMTDVGTGYGLAFENGSIFVTDTTTIKVHKYSLP